MLLILQNTEGKRRKASQKRQGNYVEAPITSAKREPQIATSCTHVCTCVCLCGLSHISSISYSSVKKHQPISENQDLHVTQTKTRDSFFKILQATRSGEVFP